MNEKMFEEDYKRRLKEVEDMEKSICPYCSKQKTVYLGGRLVSDWCKYNIRGYPKKRTCDFFRKKWSVKIMDMLGMFDDE